MKHEKGSEEAKVKEQETGEAADLGTAGDSDGRATVHSLLQKRAGKFEAVGADAIFFCGCTLTVETQENNVVFDCVLP